MNNVSLSVFDVILSFGFVLIAVVICAVLKLNLTKTLVLAGVRTIVQLSSIGLILMWIFAKEEWWRVLGVLTVMTLIAAFSAKNRIKTPYKGLLTDTIISLSVATVFVTGIAIVWILNISPWYRPQFIIPILGLILGNSLTAISLTINYFLEQLHDKKSHIHTFLTLSATPFEATHVFIKNAIITGMTPTINSMMVVGLVSLPGMMTGQILAGIDPGMAVRYQIVTMFFICAGSSISCTLATLLILRRFFNQRNQLVYPK